MSSHSPLALIKATACTRALRRYLTLAYVPRAKKVRESSKKKEQPRAAATREQNDKATVAAAAAATLEKKAAAAAAERTQVSGKREKGSRGRNVARGARKENKPKKYTRTNASYEKLFAVAAALAIVQKKR